MSNRIQLKLGQLKLKPKAGAAATGNQENKEAQSSQQQQPESSQASQQPLPQRQQPLRSSQSTSSGQLFEKIRQRRQQNISRVLDVNLSRVRVLSEPCKTINTERKKGGVLYWMSREQRAQDNWSLLYAQKLAIEHELPLYVCFCMVPTFLDATYRMYHFMIEGLKEVKAELDDLVIPFFVILGPAASRISQLVEQNNLNCVVSDFTSLRIGQLWIDAIKKKLAKDCLFVNVDSRNIVPCWMTSSQLESAAATIRPKIMSRLDEYLTEFPPLLSQANQVPKPLNLDGMKCFETDLNECYEFLEVDKSVGPCDWKPGYTGAVEELESFINHPERLRKYSQTRNDPNSISQSNLSPWLHFGQIGIQRCILQVKEHSNEWAESVRKFMDESIVWRELAENYCYYETNYDSWLGGTKWARDNLQAHRHDFRENLYSLKELEEARTYDGLWNAAQNEMRLTGKMHGYMRMYWAKKILEWTDSAENAVKYSVYLNDKYSLDGRDPNGYMGIQWSIMGVMDKPFDERPVTGKVRWMTSNGCRRKFDVELYISRINALKIKK